jgi:uncharacterized protein (TIGR02466 family)
VVCTDLHVFDGYKGEKMNGIVGEHIILFPTSIFKINIGRQLSDIEMSVANSEEAVSFGTVYTTSNKELLKTRHELSNIHSFIKECIHSYVDKVINPKYDVDFYLTESWFNYLTPGKHHHRHTHSNSIISGVFYFSADKDLDNITFFNSKYNQIDIIPKEYTLYNTSTQTIPVKTGDLLIFPSSLEHEVENTVSKDTRISLSFNTFVRGKLSDENNASKLIL